MRLGGSLDNFTKKKKSSLLFIGSLGKDIYMWWNVKDEVMEGVAKRIN
jgi:hypothetical protein